MDVEPIFCINLDIVLVIMHYALCISQYAGFGTHFILSNFWVDSDSLWMEPLIGYFVHKHMHKKIKQNVEQSFF